MRVLARKPGALRNGAPLKDCPQRQLAELLPWNWKQPNL
jgi:hypothetical protein